ncbi:uncharacterized protein LOC127868439 isoform X2 [Dreissena polymorpha]|uniref:Uncharacterized protein n=1 Tax=Dreissena polymorpha TaxID=45954 RepID=A0A9D4RJQ4_DREPO|nr:uncharacterized protein LOC127868439 isoform X2 [Dreissena polymorpha]KAH3871201.1 hypothetical protein DPMN_034395 [Dreissena polymorpha]
MAAVAVGGKAVCLDSYRAKRTEAMPKTTLFGSSLERPDENTARSVREMDLSTVTVPRTPGGKGAGQKFTLPEELKRQLPGAAVLERSRREFQNQRARVLGHSEDLRRREIEVLYGPDRFPASAPSPREPGVSRPTWFTKDDLYASNEINTLGLNNNQSFNRDKYGHKAPVHKYSLIGDVLRPGMDFPRRERTEIQMRNQGYGKGDMRGALARSPPRIGQVSAQLSRKPAELAPLVVPPNIKHKFGSKVCDNLLSDKAVVDHTIEEQKRAKETIERKSHPFIVQKFSREANPDYDMLGNALRMNVVPGYSTDQTISTTKTAFNDQVHLFRYQDPDKWRYQKDELSKWAEHNVLRQRMTKAWEAYFVETLQKKAQKQ